jgi:hypothetical protein
VLEAIMRNAEPEARERARSMLEVVTANEEQLARAKARAGNQPDDSDDEANGTSGPPTLKRPTGNSAGRQGGAQLDLPSGVQLRRPNSGEEQVRGLLVRIDCTDKSILLTIKVGDKLLKLQRARLEDIEFVTYSPDISGNVTCGVRKPENPVFVIYRPTPNARSKADGEVLSVAFVSKAMLETK